MKKPSFSGLISFVMTALLSFWVSLSASLCFAGTFGLEYDGKWVAVFCCAAALFSTLTMLPRPRWLLFAAEGLAMCGAALWHLPRLKAGLQLVLLQVTTQLSKDFPIAVQGEAGGEPLWFLLPLALLLAWVTAWTCSRRGTLLPLGVVCLPVLVCCLLTVGIAPLLWLVLLTGALVLLLITQSARAKNPVQGNRLACRLLLPTIFVLALPILLSPPEDYVRSAWSEDLLALAEGRLGIEEYVPLQTARLPARWKRELKTVDLRWVGPKSRSDRPVLEYWAETQISYLRGVSLGLYESNRWSAADPITYAQQQFQIQPQISGEGTRRTLKIRTGQTQPQLYTTYYLYAIPQDVEAIDDAYLENSQQAAEYTIDYSGSGKSPTDQYDDYVKAVYTQLPEALQAPLQEYCRLQGLNGKTAGQLANHVKNSGVYDLQTPRTPSGKDFVLYFLEESHRGYCMHFASATVLLLRAQGIPARYVSGYAVSGQAGAWNVVTADQSHAWVEYYQQGIGWRVLDPTPPEWLDILQETEEPVSDVLTPPQQTETPEQERPPVQEDDPPQEEAPPAPQQQEPSQPETQPPVRLPVLDLPGRVPSGGETSGDPAAQKVVLTRRQITALLAFAATSGLVVLQRRLRLAWKKNRRNTGSANRRALAMWRQLNALWRASGTQIDPALLALAQKARFSQHSLSDGELEQLSGALMGQLDLLKKAPPVKKLWYRFVRAFF